MLRIAPVRSIILKQIVLLSFTAILLQSCGSEPPLRIGLVTGTAGYTSDMGIEARYAIQLAVDQCNENGGIHGRRVELIVRDDQENAEAAMKDVKELIAQKVDALIGPMTSTMAVAIVPCLNEARRVMVSPTATTPLLSGRDDYFFRVCTAANIPARVNAEYQIRSKNMRRIAIAYHGGNPSYCEPIVEVFQETFNTAGGKILSVIRFMEKDRRSFFQIAEELLQDNPDGILIIANAMDSAMICQQIRKISPSVSLTLSDWSATPQLIELGGRAVEGATLASAANWDSPDPRYQQFQKRFSDLYSHPPGIFSLYSFDAAQVVLMALTARASGQDLKEALLSLEEIDGLQGKIRFDAYGDITEGTILFSIRNQKFTILE